jgi:hypothetical protein
MSEVKLCECGCGAPVSLRFVSGHNARLQKPQTPTCHPNSPHCAKGFCKPCYDSLPEVKERKHAWATANRDRVNARNRHWKATHADKHNAYNKEWAKANPDKVRAKTKRYRDRHPEKCKEWIRAWHEANPGKGIEYVHRREARIKGNGGSWTAGEWETLKRQYRYRCVCCWTPESQLNTLGRKLVPDHIIPIAKNGLNIIENLQPLCHGVDGCNNKKYLKTIDYVTS